jgi:hypothetical protein
MSKLSPNFFSNFFSGVLSSFALVLFGLSSLLIFDYQSNLANLAQASSFEKTPLQSGLSDFDIVFGFGIFVILFFAIICMGMSLSLSIRRVKITDQHLDE